MKCSRCGHEKPIQLFRTANYLKAGFKQPCQECHKANGRAYAATHRPEAKIRSAAWVKANPTKQRNRVAIWRAKNPQKARDYPNKARAADPQKARDQVNARHAANPMIARTIKIRRRARQRNLPDTFTMNDHAFMLQYWHHTCAICGNEEGFFWTLALDHVIPLSSPICPGTIATNMLPLCHGTGGCNNSKHSKDMHTWLLSRYSVKKVRQIEKAIAVYFDVVRQRQ
jgi:hypothetical protein